MQPMKVRHPGAARVQFGQVLDPRSLEAKALDQLANRNLGRDQGLRFYSQQVHTQVGILAKLMEKARNWWEDVDLSLGYPFVRPGTKIIRYERFPTVTETRKRFQQVSKVAGPENIHRLSPTEVIYRLDYKS